jgi:microcystin-dependent protein
MDNYLAEIRMFAGTFAPNGWFNCNGQLLSIAQYSALFSLLGTAFGGDGQTTFGLPDFRGRVPVSTGQSIGGSYYNLGDIRGAENVTLTSLQMPVHTHLINTQSGAADQWSPTDGIPAGSGFVSDGTEVNTYSTKVADGNLHPKTLAPAGGSQPFSIMQPTLAVTFIIAWQGIYPSRP